jgi:two-component system sensor histidine kinase LytS
MLIQLFVENSLKHGVRPLKTGGRIRISGTLESGNCLLSVTDNGIGRQKALLSGNQGTGKGLHIVDEMLHCFHTLGHTRITYTLEDLLSPGGTPSGTRVTIKIPVTT